MNTNKLFILKSIHIIIFIFISFCVIYTFYAGVTKTYNWILVLAIGAVLIEGLILLFNKWQCPLTNLVKDYGDETGRVTDMFCPAWFAPHVFRTYSALYAIGLILLGANYMIK